MPIKLKLTIRKLNFLSQLKFLENKLCKFLSGHDDESDLIFLEFEISKKVVTLPHPNWKKCLWEFFENVKQLM